MMKFYTGILTIVVLYSMIVLGALSASADPRIGSDEKMFFFHEHGLWAIVGANPRQDVYECSARGMITRKSGDIYINIVQNFGPKSQETYIRFGGNKVLKNDYSPESAIPVIINFSKLVTRVQAIAYNAKFVVIPNLPTKELIGVLLDGGKVDFIFPVHAYSIGLDGMSEIIGKLTECMAQGNLVFGGKSTRL